MFKPHLDTPRSDLHFGSLVVCLPAAHEGGQLIVRHQGHSTTFDWSKDSTNLQWAAFYGDCEHEVSQVTLGYRITLTYNLFIRCGLGEIVGSSSTLDVSQLPVYNEVQAALANPVFFPDGTSLCHDLMRYDADRNTGGHLAKYCSHAYAHTTKEGISALPAILKGSDMVTHEIFRSLGIQVDIRPALDLFRERAHGWLEDDSDYFTHDCIGKKLSESVGSSLGGYEECSTDELISGFPHDKLMIKWLNEPVTDTRNVQYNYMVVSLSLVIYFQQQKLTSLVRQPGRA